MVADNVEKAAPAFWLFNNRPSYVHDVTTASSEQTSMDGTTCVSPSPCPASSEKNGRADPPRLSDVSAPDSAVHPAAYASYDTDIEAMVPSASGGRSGGRPGGGIPGLLRHGAGNSRWLAQNQRRQQHGWFTRHTHLPHHHHHHSPCRGFGVTAEVWPGQRHWKMKAKEQKMQRSCTGLSRLSKRKRMAVKILIGLLVVGVAVAVGLGISKALGAPMWSLHDYRNFS